MAKRPEISDAIFNERESFYKRGLFTYRYQVTNNPIYRIFASHYYGENEHPETLSEIPLLPIRAFKELDLIVEGKRPSISFRSSGTGSMQRSRHLVADSGIYRTAIVKGINEHFELNSSTLLCYTPGYSENPDSSLLWMLNHLIENDSSGLSRFLPLDQPIKKEMIEKVSRPDRTLILFGAAFGLLDLLEAESDPLPDSAHIIETGGMKTYRREISKEKLRSQLSEGFGIPGSQIHSEYGMCELLSQMYAIGGTWFSTPHWMYASVRDPKDPATECKAGEEGKIGIIDLANIYSCPFLLTEDRGVMDSDGRVSIAGRWNPADLRGCNFLIDLD
ncbi:acyltransferase [soil metagenome]